MSEEFNEGQAVMARGLGQTISFTAVIMGLPSQ